jgi:hypothetical protein
LSYTRNTNAADDPLYKTQINSLTHLVHRNPYMY